MDFDEADERICRAHCLYYKPNRIEEERCRGYSLACRLSPKGRAVMVSATSPPFDPAFKKAFFRSHVCEACPFLIDGCDFTSPAPPKDCLPCGGLVVLSRLHAEGRILEEDLVRADLLDRAAGAYLSLAPRCALKQLEEPYLYHIGTDELYEVNDEALQMLLRCDGSHLAEDLAPDPDFLQFCIEEDLLELHETPRTVPVPDHRSPTPSLRYLEWLITLRCNLSCAHCYLGDAKNLDYPVEWIRPLLEQFTEIQGLRILVSGGEPTLYPHFRQLNEALPDYPVRSVLLTNGFALTPKAVADLNFHEVQISLDGMERGHDLIRGKGSFRKAVAAMEAVRADGLDLSVATMIHQGNLSEWEEMRSLITDLGAREWSIDYPCVKGRWESAHEMVVDPNVATEKMGFGFGGSYHGTSPGWTCGHHLAAVLPDGALCKCGLLQDQLYGFIQQGLAKAWARVEHIPIETTKCAGCAHADTCGGGCRFRAGGGDEPDEIMCRFYGVSVQEPTGEFGP
jgi:radical SAM protein with 4Fe4S-binding SPASM domain